MGAWSYVAPRIRTSLGETSHHGGEEAMYVIASIPPATLPSPPFPWFRAAKKPRPFPASRSSGAYRHPPTRSQRSRLRLLTLPLALYRCFFTRRYVGRKPSDSVATGDKMAHKKEQATLVDEALTV